MFAGAFPVLQALNVMQLKTPESAICPRFSSTRSSSLPCPLALRGVKYAGRGVGTAALESACVWRRRVIAPFIGIKLIDMIITRLHWA